MFFFKFNPIDEEIFANNAGNFYMYSCDTINNKKVITSYLGKRTMEKTNVETFTLAKPLALWYSPKAVVCTGDVVSIIDNALDSKNSIIYVDTDVGFINNPNMLHIVDDQDLTKNKVRFIQQINGCLDKLIISSQLSMFIKTALNVQKLILDNKITVTSTTVAEQLETIKQILTEDLDPKLKTEVSKFINNLPIDELPTLVNLNFEALEETDIVVLDGLIYNLNILIGIFNVLYRIVRKVIHAETEEMLHNLETEFFEYYYNTIKSFV